MVEHKETLKVVVKSRAIDSLRILMTSQLEGAHETLDLLVRQLVMSEVETLGLSPRKYFQCIIELLEQIRDRFPSDETKKSPLFGRRSQVPCNWGHNPLPASQHSNQHSNHGREGGAFSFGPPPTAKSGTQSINPLIYECWGKPPSPTLKASPISSCDEKSKSDKPINLFEIPKPEIFSLPSSDSPKAGPSVETRQEANDKVEGGKPGVKHLFGDSRSRSLFGVCHSALKNSHLLDSLNPVVDPKNNVSIIEPYCGLSFMNQKCWFVGVSKNGRYHFINDFKGNNWIIDTFNSRRCEITIDYTNFRPDFLPDSNTWNTRSFLYEIYFVDEHEFLSLLQVPVRGRWTIGVATGRFDFTDCTMKISDLIEKLTSTPNIIKDAENTQPFGIITANVATDHYESLTISEGRLTFGVPIRIPKNLRRVTRYGNKLIGFEEVNRHLLVEIPLDGNEIVETNIEAVSLLDKQYLTYRTAFNGRAFFELHGATKSSNCSILMFNLSTNKWCETKTINSEGSLMYKSTSNNLFALSKTLDYPDFIQIYHIYSSSPDSLLNLSWLSFRKFANTDPEFYTEVLEKLPKHMAIRCPKPKYHEAKPHCGIAKISFLFERTQSGDANFVNCPFNPPKFPGYALF